VAEDFLPAPVVDIHLRNVAQTLVVATMVLEVDEAGYRLSESAGSRVGHQPHLALDLWVVSNLRNLHKRSLMDT